MPKGNRMSIKRIQEHGNKHRDRCTRLSRQHSLFLKEMGEVLETRGWTKKGQTVEESVLETLGRLCGETSDDPGSSISPEG